MDSYKELTKILDKNDASKRFKKSESFFDKTFKKHNVKSVLDCSCGAGVYVYHFLKKGYDAVGSDISKATITLARKKYPSIKSKLHIADFRLLNKNFKQKFDCVICWATSFPHMMNDKDALKALKSMYNQLDKNGILMIQQVIHDNVKFDAFPVINNEKESLIYSFTDKDKIVEIRIIYLQHTKTKKDFKRFTVTYNATLTKSKMERLLRKTGFKNIQFYGDYNFKKYNPKKSNNLILIAKK